MNKCTILLLLVFHFLNSNGQGIPLFQAKDPVNLRMTGSIKSIKKTSNDSTFVTGSLQYLQGLDQWITVPAKVRARGNFRLKHCFFPPLKLKFNKKAVASTLFEGNNALKLVVPCLTNDDKNNLIRREYICYQFYQVLSPYYFKTRLANLEFTEVSRKKPRTYALLSFFVEDNSMVAKRDQGKVIETKGIRPETFDETQSARNDFFQYMIGNADWSDILQHNSNTLYVDGKYISLSYDYDMSGFVDAFYAQQHAPTLGTGDVRERVYRGFCKPTPIMEEVRKEFLEKESVLHALIDEHQMYFSKAELNDMNNYLDDFFAILKSDRGFKNAMVEGCRKQ